MATIYSRQTGEAHEVEQETFDSLLTGEWPRGLELYDTDPPVNGQVMPCTTSEKECL